MRVLSSNKLNESYYLLKKAVLISLFMFMILFLNIKKRCNLLFYSWSTNAIENKGGGDLFSPISRRGL